MSIDPFDYGTGPHGRAREFLRPGGVINRRLVPSIKMNRQIHCEGDNERNAVTLLEVFPDVASYQEQPKLGLTIEIGGREREVFPDLEIVYRDGVTEVVDVIRLRHLQRADKLERFRAVGKKCRQLGYHYRLWADSDIERQPRLAAAEEVCWRGRTELPDSVKQCALEHLPMCRTIADFERASGATRAIVCALVLQGYIAIDITQGLGAATPVVGRGWKMLSSETAKRY